MQVAAAESLFKCLVAMGEQNSNPVLQLFDSNIEIQQKKKYPEGLLQCNDTGWRAYYHCHDNKDDISHLFETEHGHFHIFVRLTEQPESWTHVVALSIDEMGQPLRWFMVNHWVTGETWLDAPLLLAQLHDIPFMEQNTLLEQWLLSMLALYKNEIKGLLALRDDALNTELADGNIKQDKEYYLLSEQEIKLQNKLQQVLTKE